VAENSPLKTINTLIFRCVPNDKCTGLLNVRGSDDLVCEDSSQKCCHEYSVIENGKDENSNIGSSEIDYYDNKEYCSAYENEGYRFVINCIHIISKYFHMHNKNKTKIFIDVLPMKNVMDFSRSGVQS